MKIVIINMPCYFQALTNALKICAFKNYDINKIDASHLYGSSKNRGYKPDNLLKSYAFLMNCYIKWSYTLINNFKNWFEQLAENANERKKQNPLENGQLPKWNNTTKNKEIKHKFTQEAYQIKGITPRSSNNDEAGREWLYDLIWREYDSNNFSGVKLAMEIELSDMKERGLVYDFNKLLQSDAEYKVFVFQQKTINETKKLFAIV